MALRSCTYYKKSVSRKFANLKFPFLNWYSSFIPDTWRDFPCGNEQTNFYCISSALSLEESFRYQTYIVPYTEQSAVGTGQVRDGPADHMLLRLMG